MKTEANIISSLDFVMEFMERNYAQKKVKSVTPYAFALGSNNNGEGLEYNMPASMKNSIFYGNLQVSINPNDADLQPEKIQIKYRSYMNHTPFYKVITRIVEKENLINEQSVSLQLFDDLTVTQRSTKYDFYFEFVGYKIDLI